MFLNHLLQHSASGPQFQFPIPAIYLMPSSNHQLHVINANSLLTIPLIPPSVYQLGDSSFAHRIPPSTHHRPVVDVPISLVALCPHATENDGGDLLRKSLLGAQSSPASISESTWATT